MSVYKPLSLPKKVVGQKTDQHLELLPGKEGVPVSNSDVRKGKQ